MLWKYKKCYQETNQEIETPQCNNRYLSTVIANPNINGGCGQICVSFHYAGWSTSDEIESFCWDESNIGKVFSVERCIDLNTLTFNCIGRVTFTWNDLNNCCI